MITTDTENKSSFTAVLQAVCFSVLVGVGVYMAWMIGLWFESLSVVRTEFYWTAGKIIAGIISAIAAIGFFFWYLDEVSPGEPK